MNTNTRADAQGQGPKSHGHFSIEDAVLIVDTDEDAHAAREHLRMEAFVYDRLAEQLPPGGLTGSTVVVSAHDACARANSLIAGGAPRMGVMFVDLAPLQGQTLRSLAEEESGRNYLNMAAAEPVRPHPALSGASAAGLGGARAARADPLWR